MATKPDYGLEAPQMVRRLASRSFLMLALAAIFYFVERTKDPKTAVTILILLVSVGLILGFVPLVMVLSSRAVKPRVCRRLVDSLPWRGDEKVLDVGCGRGVFLIQAAKRLKTGEAIGIDNWKAGRFESVALDNAKLEGVADRVKIQTADALKLPFEDASFDVVLSSLALQNLNTGHDRKKAVEEMARVLKPGGRLAIFDVIYTGSYRKKIEELSFEDIWASPTTFLWCMPTRSITARKT